MAGTIALAIAIGGSVWWTRHHRAQQAAEQVAEQAAAQAAAQPPETAAPAPEPAPVEESMTNDDVLKLVAAKVPTDQIIAQIASAKSTQFVTGTDAVIQLNQAHVPGIVIQAMRDPEKAAKLMPPPASTPAHSTPKQVQAPAPAVVNAQVSNPPPAAPSQPQPAGQAPAAAQQPTQQAAVKQPSAAGLPASDASVAAKSPATGKALTVVTLSDATPFHITLADDIPAEAKKDTPIRFIVTSDVVVAGDKVAIAKGAKVTGVIVEERKKGVFGSGLGGKSVTFKLTKVEAADHTLAVRAEPTKTADHPVESSANGKVKATDAAAAPAGTEYVAYIDGDQTVTVGK